MAIVISLLYKAKVGSTCISHLFDFLITLLKYCGWANRENTVGGRTAKILWVGEPRKYCGWANRDVN